MIGKLVDCFTIDNICFIISLLVPISAPQLSMCGQEKFNSIASTLVAVTFFANSIHSSSV
jgi:hypothetical protein